MLTAKQKDLLVFIHDRVQESGVPPSFDEMKEALDLRSKSGIHRLITALEERGFIRRLPHRARALEIIKLPDAMTPEGQARRVTAQLAQAQLASVPTALPHRLAATTPAASARMPQLPVAAMARSVTVPLMGRIAAGVPISAIQNHQADIECPPDLIAGGEHFALEVKGDSMIEAGILEGDIVIIRRAASADNGDIVVALVDNEEATLKRLRKRGAAVALEAANPAYETRIFGPDQVNVQGRLVGLIRRY